MAKEDEDDQLRSVAMQNARSVHDVKVRAEEALRKQSEWLKITLASIGDGVISTDAEGRVTFINMVAERLTGWTSVEAVGQPLQAVFHIVHERTRQPAENPAIRALQEGTIVGLANHTVLIARDGTERPIDDSAAPIREGDEAYLGAVLVFRDVSERRQAERTQTRLAAIVESSEDAIVSKTLDGTIRSWNAAAERLFGYSAPEMIGNSIMRIIPPELHSEEGHIVDRLKRGERIEHYETVRVAKDGRRLDIALTVSPLRDSDGSIVGASKIARDITERKRAESALRDSEARYRQAAAEAAQTAEANAKFRAFFEQGTNFAGVLSLEGVVVEANRLCLDACGFTREEVIGKPFWECGWWNRSDALKDVIRSACRVAAEGQVFRSESIYFVADGSQRIVDLILAPVTDNLGRTRFVAATGTDITARRRMEDALRDNDRKKDEFLALLAHELRNPLAPLRNGLEVMRLAPDDVEGVAQARAMMERQLGHMIRLIDDLLDISRVSRNKLELRLARLALSDIINTAVETARPAIELAGHELILTLPAKPIYLDADLTRLAQVFSNLLTNSAKYTEPVGRIHLTAEREGDTVVVSVSDNGIGIPSESLPRIFDMFSQVDRSLERSTGGLGIGLALVKGLVEMHGGTVTVASEGQDKGSTFSVRLPALPDDTRPTETVSTTGLPASGPGRRILVVDDNRDSAISMAMMLRLMGNDVRTGHDGLEAVATAAEFRPDVILMDVGMPRLNGLDACREIRSQPWGRSILIIALTGWGQENDKIRSQEAGCDSHLVKPVDLGELNRLLRELADSRESKSARRGVSAT